MEWAMGYEVMDSMSQIGSYFTAKGTMFVKKMISIRFNTISFHRRAHQSACTHTLLNTHIDYDNGF